MRVDTDALLDLLPDVVIAIEHDGTVTYASAATERILGWPPAEVVGRSAFEFVNPAERDQAIVEIAAQVEDGDDGTRRHHVELVHRDGGLVKFELLAALAPDGLLLVLRDISERAEYQKQLHRSDEQLRALTENVPDAVGRFDQDTRLVFASRRFGELVAEHTGLVDDWVRHAHAVLADGERLEVEQIVGDRSGWLATRFVPELGPDGEVTHVLVIATDVTHRKENELRLIRAASHDPLTGLLNRDRFREAAERTLARRHDAIDPDVVEPVVLVFIDLDDFKVVNDAHGHPAGDVVLAQVGRRLADVVRPQDLVARYGGDEFVMLCHGIGVEDAGPVLERIVATISEPVVLQDGDTRVVVGASIGVASASPVVRTFDELLACADRAMYEAKAAG